MTADHSLRLRRGRRPARVAVVGGFGQGNVGDDLLGVVLWNRLRPRALLSTDPGTIDGIDVLPLDALERLEPEIDLLLIGGGGLLYNRYIRRLRLRYFRKPYAFLSVGIPHAAWLEGIEETVAAAEFVTLRDRDAVATFRSWLPAVEAWWLPDPVFMLPPQRVTRRTDARPLVLLNARWIPEAWMRPGEPPDAVDRQIDVYNDLAKRYGDAVRFEAIGFSTQDEPVLSRLTVPWRVVEHTEAVRTIAAADGIVATRLHAGIIAATQGTPFALVDYQDKVRGLARVLGAEERCVRFTEVERVESLIREVVASPGRRADVRTPRALGDTVDRFLGRLWR